MSREWKPGDVGVNDCGERFIVTRGGQCAWASLNGHDVVSGRPTGTDRPLFVIDPEDREQVERLALAYHRPGGGGLVNAMQAALRSLIAEPKPDEPQGLGAVVEDAQGGRWAKARLLPDDDLGGQWVGGVPARWAKWESVDAVRVVSE